MEIKKIKNILLVSVFIIQLVKSNCSNNYNNAFLSELRLKRGSTIQHSTIGHLLLPQMSFHKNLHDLPENAIYCTRALNSNTEYYNFLYKYYSAIRGKPANYVNALVCIYPKTAQFPEKPLKSIDRFIIALRTESDNFRKFLDKVNRGEQPEPFKTMDVKAMADEIMDDIFHHNPDRAVTLESSAPYGVICEHLKFSEATKEGVVLEIERPICYAAQRPPIVTTTTPSPTTKSYHTVTKSGDAEFLNKACYVLCHTGLIYQILPCCRK